MATSVKNLSVGSLLIFSHSVYLCIYIDHKNCSIQFLGYSAYASLRFYEFSFKTIAHWMKTYEHNLISYEK